LRIGNKRNNTNKQRTCAVSKKKIATHTHTQAV